MDSTELKNISQGIAQTLALIPALAPYSAPIALGLAVAAAIAPPIYEEVMQLISQVKSDAPPTDEQLAKLHVLLAALKTPDDYFNDGVASATPTAPASLNFIR